MLRIEVTTLINRPVQEVWDFFTDLTNSPRWTRSGSELRQTTTGPLGVGTTIQSVRPVVGREIKSQTIVVTQYEPEHLMFITAAVPLFGHAAGGFTFETVGRGTRLSRWGELELGRTEGLLGPILTRVHAAQWVGDRDVQPEAPDRGRSLTTGPWRGTATKVRTL